LIRVGLVGPPERAEIERLAIRLEERGGEAVVLDPRRDPRIELGAGRASACGENLAGIRSVYVADLGVPSPVAAAPGGGVDVAASLAALDASRRRLAAWKALLDRLARVCLVVNPPATHLLHALKPYEIAVYAAAGLPAPATVATTDPRALAELPGAASSAYVRKGMVGGYGHTEALPRPGSAAEAARLLEGTPLMAQERIEGDNVRAFVVGAECVGAAEVIPVDGREVDSRRGETRVRRIEPPPEAARDAVAAAGRWGMSFAAVDFMRDTRTGRFVLLECNSAPFFVAFEARTGIDVSGRLATHLLAKRRA
jgi:glutathione synthase/RimK-type ligase-like ATP-grasp enzyme